MRLSQIGILTLASLGLTFLALPIAALVIRAISTRAWEGAPDSVIPDAIYLSFITTLATAILTLLFGTPLAYVFTRRKFRFKRLLNVLIELPIVLPPAVAGLALLITFGRRGLLGPPLLLLGISLPFTVYAVIMAQALSSNFGRDSLPDERLRSLVRPDHLHRAHCWGLAMRLGQRLSGGVSSVLERTSLTVDDGVLCLNVPQGEQALAGDAVRRRQQRLADALQLDPTLSADG